MTYRFLGRRFMAEALPRKNSWPRIRIREPLVDQKRGRCVGGRFFWREPCFDGSVAGFTESDRIRAFRNELRAAQLKLGTRSGTVRLIGSDWGAEKIAEDHTRVILKMKKLILPLLDFIPDGCRCGVCARGSREQGSKANVMSL